MGKLSEAARDWAIRGLGIVLLGLACWVLVPLWPLWKATGFEVDRSSARLRVTNGRTTALDALRVHLTGTVASQLTAQVEGEAMAEVTQADPLAHRFQKMADGSDATLGQGASLELASTSGFDFRRDVRTMVLFAKDGFSTNLEMMEAVQPVKWVLFGAIGVLALCLAAPRVRRRLRPTSVEKAVKLAGGTAAEKERFRRAFWPNAMEQLELLVVIDTMAPSDVQHVVYAATLWMLNDAGGLLDAKGAGVTAWVRLHTEAALHQTYAARSAHGNPGWVLR
jgi:hypothetical protein